MLLNVRKVSNENTSFDPYLTDEKAKSLSITKATVDEIAQHSDFVTLHTPLTPKTKGLINADFLPKQNLVANNQCGTWWYY